MTKTSSSSSSSTTTTTTIIIYQFSSGPLVTGFQLLWLPLSVSSDVKFLCFITLATFFSHFTVDCPCHHHLPGDQVIIHLGCLLSSMHTTYPYHFNMLFSSLSKIVCVAHIFSLITTFLFSLITTFLFYSSVEILAVLLQNSVCFYT